MLNSMKTSLQSAPRVREHLVWLDVVRFAAMFTVVCCHCADPFNFFSGEMPANIDDIKFWGAAYASLLRPCVPLFVMITGTLLLPVRGDTGQFYRKRISRVFWPFLIWSVLYCLFPWLMGLLGFGSDALRFFYPYLGEEASRQSFADVWEYLSAIPLNFVVFDVHMWYIYLLIGLYLYMPIFSAWIEKATERAKHWFLVAWGVTLFVPYMRVFIEPYFWGSCTWNEFYMLYYFAGFNGYLLLGHCLSKLEWPMRKALLWGIPMFVVGYVATYLGFRHMTTLPEYSAEQLELFIYYCSPNVVLMTIPVFLICKAVTVRAEWLKRALANLTVCGFGVYMIHYIFTGPSVTVMRALNVPLGLQIPCAAVVAFSISWLLVYLIRKVSGEKVARYLVG